MSEYVWITKPNEIDTTYFEIAKELLLHPKLAFLLANRKINSQIEAHNFFNPKISDLHNPMLMKDMEKAVQRVIKAIELQQKILVYGDYDVDGTTAVAIFYSFLKKLDCNVEFYVPDRLLEGYGVSMKGMEYANAENFNLIVTLDCGIKALQTIAYANAHAIDVIVCDHHEPGNELPQAFAILNPKQKDCTYPFKELSGCGVGFKLLQGICNTLKINEKENLYCYLDILAVSIASDIVPIIDENRIYMHFGLLKMQKKPSIGIHAMMITSGMEGNITVSDVVFKIGPRINAAGRIKSARTAIELLITTEHEQAVEVCKEIDSNNILRREIDKTITNEALQLIESDCESKNKVTNVLYKPLWNKGVIGIVASRIIEKHYKPSIIFCGSDDIITGSARSVADFDLYSALEKCEEFFIHFGGHTFAAGMSIPKEKFNDFATKFNEVVANQITEEQKIPKIEIDAELGTIDITEHFYNNLQKFAPFGPHNMTPIFIIKNLKDSGNSKSIGKDGTHLKLSLYNEKYPHTTIQGIGFGMADKWELLKAKNATIDVCFALRENIFRNNKTIQLEIRDVRESLN